MTLKEAAIALGWKKLNGADEETAISGGFTSDLLSDVMGNAPANSVFITIQAHKNTVAVASLASLAAILICARREASVDMLAAADAEGIAVYSTPDNQFLASVRLGRLLDIS